MKQFGLLGEKLSHSFSPMIHKFFYPDPYTLFEVEKENLDAFLKKGDFDGINVTIPYKKAVIPYLDELSPVAQKLQNVNTIIKKADGTLLSGVIASKAIHHKDKEDRKKAVAVDKLFIDIGMLCHLIKVRANTTQGTN